MMSSQEILTVLRNSFDAYLNWSDVSFEMFRIEPIRLETRWEMYGMARVAIYEQNATTSLSVDAGRPYQVRQNYGVDISVRYSTTKDNQDDAEFIALDIKDKLIEWIWAFKAFEQTEQTLFALKLDSITPISRNDKFCTLTVNLFSTRKIYIQN